jgi:hypothetical protein
VSAASKVLGLSLFAAFARALGAQGAPTWISAGSAEDDYFRVAQLAGAAPPTSSLTIRFLRDVSGELPQGNLQHPWKRRWSAARRTGSWSFSILPVETQTIFNTTLPYGYNDGAIWAGKGLTQSIQAGIAVHAGPLSLVAQPLAFWTQNKSFTLEPNPYGSADVYASPIAGIDMPQRWGPKAYGRIDPGQSTLQLTLGPMSGGLTTANDSWGPALESPLILGTNAPGIPRLFLGTVKPMWAWAGSVEGRVFWGKSTLSPYVPGSFGGARKFATGAVVAFTPRGLSNLTVGAVRFFHMSSDSGLPPRYFTRLIQGLLQRSFANPLEGDDPTEDQLASVFFRWAFPGEGFEIFGEFGREDTAYDLRDLTLQLYHDAAYVLGLQRVWRSADSTRYTSFRAEVVNTRIGPLFQASPQAPWYIHDVKGHTERGQVLGAPFGLGGGSMMASVTRYAASGWTRIHVGRLMTREILTPTLGPVAERAGVIAAFGIERMRFGVQHRPDLSIDVTVSRNYNRPDGAPFNLTTGLRVSLPK